MTTSTLAPACRVHFPANRPPEFHTRDIYALRGLARHPLARAMARRLDPCIFADGAVRLLATSLVMGTDPPTPHERHAAAYWRLFDLVDSCRIDHQPGWSEAFAIDLLRQLAAEQYREVLASQFIWAAERIRAGDPIRFIRERVGHAFRVAAGEEPLIAGGWEVAA